MYSTCLYCHTRFRTNDEIEHQSLGNRLAFDAERGRLWVICGRCRGWNLTPFEDRWEALEDCGRRFAGAKRVASTEQITLAYVSPRLQLVRVGRPKRPEFVAWRYGSRLGSRRRWSQAKLGLAAVGALGLSAAGVSAFGALGITGLMYAAVVATQWTLGERSLAVIGRLPRQHGAAIPVTREDLRSMRLLPFATESWRVSVGAAGSLHGHEALQALGLLLPLVNRWGGTERQRALAVSHLESATEPERFFYRLAMASSASLVSLPPALRLAAEIAAHEDSERLALRGELWLLERAWKEAEEVAAIADSLLAPPDLDAWILQAKERLRRVPA